MSQPQSITDITHDHELDVLSQIHQNEKAKQREIAHAVGLSLGMTNAILKRLVNKGFLTMRKLNARNIHYLVTADGIDLIARRSYRYLRRTVGHVVRYKESIRELLHDAALAPPEGRGVTRVVLVGESDLEFLVEWCAEKEGLGFDVAHDTATAPVRGGETFVIAGEREPLRLAVVPAVKNLAHAVLFGEADVPAKYDLHLADLVVTTRHTEAAQ